jgi:hypothetical protein
MNDSGERDHLSNLLNIHMAIVEVGIAETNEESWLRHGLPPWIIPELKLELGQSQPRDPGGA